MAEPTWLATLERAAKDGSAPDDEPGFYAVDFAEVVPPLDALAARLGVTPLSAFYFDDSVFDNDLANEILAERHGPDSGPEDVDEDTFEQLPDLIRVWRSWRRPFYPPDDGLRTVQALSAWVEAHPEEIDPLGLHLNAEGVVYVLGELREVLEYAQRVGRQFRVSPPGPD